MVWYVIEIYFFEKTNKKIYNLGVSLQCQISGENLECVLSLPDKYRTHIEGLTGNYNGIYGDDLINRRTNQTVSISPSNNDTAFMNDADVLNACLSCKFSMKNKEFCLRIFFIRESIH